MKKITNSIQLIKWLEQKDNRAFQYLYSTFYSPLFILAKSYTKDPVLAEDIIQDLFLHLFENQIYFKTENDVRYYLYSLLKNRCIDFHRKQQVNQKYREEITKEQSDIELFWEKALKEEVYASLLKAIDSLPPQSQKVILYSLEGMKLAEIADKLKISIYTVKEYKKNAIKRLSILLKPHQYMLLFLFDGISS